MLSEVLRQCEAVLRYRDVYYSGALCAELQCAFEEISRSARRPSAAVLDDAPPPQEGIAGFSRVIVLDATHAVTAAGFFEFNVFIEVIARAITEALGLDLDARNLHREQLSQLLKDERGILFCFFSLDDLTEDHYRQLRGLGFTQTDHRILFCGQSEFLQKRSTSLAESLDATDSFDAVLLESENSSSESHRESEAVAHLRILTGGSADTAHAFSFRGASIGRVGGDCDIVVDDDRISRRHARIERGRAGWHFQDRGARNRGYVNGRGYAPGERVPLTDGAVLRLGNTLMVFRTTAPSDDHQAYSPSFPGFSPAAVAVRRRIDTLARATGHVLIIGEIGAGKKQVARAIAKRRGQHPFVTLNSAALSRGLAHAELFGYGNSALPDANGNKLGLVDAARDGVVFLDEIGALSLDVQAHLLRFLDDGAYRPLGSAELRHSNARVLAATHLDLDRAAETGKFRRDLLARLRAGNTPLELPPLRERREDILRWTDLFFRQQNRGTSVMPWTTRALECLLLYPWTCNLRDLRSVVVEACERTSTFPCGMEHLPASLRGHPRTVTMPLNVTPPDETRPSEPTKAEIEQALRETRGNMRMAAQRLVIDRGTLYRLCERFGITRDVAGGEPVRMDD
jgi:DNA-binding NtrC family response regulator